MAKKQRGLQGLPSIVEQRKRQELDALRGWSDLSLEERDAFLEKFPKLKDKSFRYISNVYDNRHYIDTFGMPDFENDKDKASRDARYRNYVLRDAAQRLYGNESRDVQNKIASLSPEGLEELIGSNYVTEKEKKELAPYLENYEELKNSVGGRALLSLLKLNKGTTMGAAANNAELLSQGLETNNSSILDRIYNDDNRKKRDSAAALTQEYDTKLTELGSQFVEENWDALANGSKESTGYGSDVEEEGIGLYKLFKDRHEMRDFGYADKKKMLAEYYALLDLYKNPATAKQVLTTELQDYIHEGQNAWDWWSSAISGIGTKAAADIMQTYIGVAALAGDFLWGDEWLAQYLQGKDENGNERALMNNLRYWNGVDMFNTFSNSLIGEIEDNGGISPYNWLSKAGNERNIISALNEGVKMTGYMVAQMVLARGIGKGMGQLAKNAGGVFNAGQFVVEGSTKQAMNIMKYWAPLTTSAVNAISISTGYAKGSFDKVLQENREQISLYKELEAAQYVNNILGENSGIKWTEHGYEGSKDVFGSNDRAAEMNAWIAERVAQLEQEGYSPEEIDISELAKQALSNYKEHSRQEYINNLDSSLFWQNADKRALEEAASAYERNATIEFLRMSGINYVFKSLLNDKSVRRAQASNYPGLEAGRGAGEAEQIVAKANFLGREVNPKIARFYGAAKSLYGGWESNYFDDVWANYSQAFSKGRFNNYMGYHLDGNKAAYASDWTAGFLSGIRGFEEALVDPQSWYDGLIGALGTVEGFTFRSGMFRNSTLNSYDEAQLAKYAALSGMNVEEYVRGDYTALKERIHRTNPKLSDERVDELVGKAKETYGFKKMVQEGNIEELSFLEKANNYFGNALMQEYADALSREREFKGVIKAGNKAIADKKDAINDIIRAINSVSLRKLTEYGGIIADMKEAKAFEGFELIRTLEDWKRNPILSKAEFVLTAQRQLERLASGNITQEDITAFLANADNKSEVGNADSESFARERLQSNAKQLLEIQEQYKNARKEVEQSKGYLAVRDSDVFEDLLAELVFNRVMKAQREKRISQMNSETEGTSQPSVATGGDALARFASEKGYEAHMKALDEQIEDAEKIVKDAENGLRDARRVRGIMERRRAVEAAELALDDAEQSLSSLKATKSQYAALHESGIDFSRVLTKEEIMGLPAEERAIILNPNNLRNYSKEQQAVIRQLDAEMKAKDPNYYEKIQDIAELVNRNNDLVRVNQLMEDNMPAALGYFNYARQIRQQQALRALQLQQFDRKSSQLENAPTSEDRVRIAKGTGYAFLKDYIDKHPEHKDELSGTLNLLKLKGDFKVATANAIPSITRNWESGGLSLEAINQGIPAVQRTMQEFIRSFDRLLQSEDVKTEEDMMGKLEEYRERLTDGQGYFDVVLDETVKLNHQRNATKIQEIADRKAAEEYRRKQAEAALGKNFGFDGFMKGDIVYHKSGKTGTVIMFSGTKDDGRMHVAWTDQSGTIIYRADEVKDLVSKTPFPSKPATPAQAPAPTQQAAPQVAPENVPTAVPVEELFDFTPDGELIQKSEEEQGAAASMQSKGSSFVVDNVNRGVLGLQDVYQAGLLVGDAIYEYDLRALDGLRVQKRRTPARPDDTMSAFFNWLDSKGIKLQEIIDNELYKIFKAAPKTPVKFMIVNEPGMELHVLEVMEYSGVVAKVHDEEAIKKWGKPVSVGGKEYLVIGTLGYDRSQNNSAAFFRIANTVRDGARANKAFANGETMYVHDGIHTQIARIGTGAIFKQGVGETEAKFRTLGELFADPLRNPNKMSFSNAIFGIMYANKYFVTSRTPVDGVMFPPGKSESTLGRVFVMVKATNGNYSPVALKNHIKLNDLNDGQYKDIIYNYIRDLASPDFNDRRTALAELSKMLVLNSTSNIRIGNPNDNRVSVIRNGVRVWSSPVDGNFRIDELEREIEATNFEINIVQETIENPTAMAMLDAAGGLQTDVSALRTTNASFDVFEVGEKGEPIIIPVGHPEPDSRKENQSRREWATVVNGSTYRLIDGEYYDSLTNVVSDKDLRFSIHWGIEIQRKGLVPAFVSSKGNKYYVTNADRDNPGAIVVDKSHNAKELSADKALGLIDYAAKMAAEEAARIAAEEEAERLMALAQAQREGIEGFIDPADVYQEPEPLQRQPIQPAQPPQQAPAHPDNSAGFKEDPNKASDKTLTQLQADKKTTNFAFVWVKRRVELMQIIADKGWQLSSPGTIRQAEALFKEKLGPSFNPGLITNEEAFIDLIKSCK